MNRFRSATALICIAWLLGACGSCGATTSTAAKGPTPAELAAAAISGTWTLTVTVASYSGPPPPASNRFQVGHKATDTVTFVSQCTGTSCTLEMWGPAGPDPSQAAYFRFYSNDTGLLGPPVSTPMTESGATYSQAIPIGGFGGRFICPPSQTVPRPEQRLSLKVTGAAPAGSGWKATAMTGTESTLSGWGCGASGFTGWTVAHLAISGKPAS